MKYRFLFAMGDVRGLEKRCKEFSDHGWEIISVTPILMPTAPGPDSIFTLGKLQGGQMNLIATIAARIPDSAPSTPEDVEKAKQETELKRPDLKLHH